MGGIPTPSAVNGLLVFSVLCLLMGFVVLFRALRQARGFPRTPWQLLGVAGSFLCLVTASTAFYFALRVKDQLANATDYLGYPVPEVRYRTLPDDSVHTSQEWKGKLVILNYWATWCVPCREELPAYGRIAPRYPGIRTIALSDERAEAVQAFVQKENITVPVGVLEGKSFPGAVAARPVTFVIDAHGVIRESRLGVMQEAEIEKLYQRYSKSE